MKGIRMQYPATRWQDALPAGNGSLGALVYGQIRDELVIINHEALFLAQEKPVIEPIYQHLAEYRRMLLEGRYREGNDFFVEKIKEHYAGIHTPAPYMPAFDIKLHTETKSAFCHYARSVDFTTGEVMVAWQDSGVDFKRRLFVSRADDCVAMEISASQKGAISCDITLDAHDSETAFSMGAGQVAKESKIPFAYETAGSGEELTFTATQKNGEQFGGMARVIVSGGKAQNRDGKIYIKDTDRVLVLVRLFVRQDAVTAQKELKAALDGLPTDYNRCFASHAELHEALFNRMTLELGGGDSPLTNEELLMQGYNGKVSVGLIQRMFDYGRYLLICSSRPGGMPANLQGVWNGDYKPAWASDYHNDENVQMNYWAALPGNLAETVLPYFDYYESMLPDYRENAAKLYGCRGIFIPIAQTTHGLLYGASVWSSWTGGAAWLAQLFYDYWLFTGDTEFLKNRAVPFLKEVALFYEDFLVEGPDGKLLFTPSMSPENVPDKENASIVTINATMDVALAKEILSNLCTACRLLEIEPEACEKWSGMLKKLPEYQVNEDGAFREWLYPGLKDNYRHRHVSHIYPLFPGFEITKENNAAFYESIRVAVQKRLVIGFSSQTGWSLAHLANIHARLEDGNEALGCLQLLCRACVGQNLFTYHNDWRSQGITMYWGHGNPPPFQIDANFGFTAAVLEMLVFSLPGMVRLLPALPDSWKTGRFEHLLCRGGITVSAEWDADAKTLKASLLSDRPQEITLQLPWDFKKIQASGGESKPSPLGTAYRLIRLEAGKTLILDCQA